MQSLDAAASYYGISAMKLLWTLKDFGLIKQPTFDRLNADLKKAVLPDRPPLQFGTWLKILESAG